MRGPGKLVSALRRLGTLRLRLALLYAGFFFACGVGVLAIPIFTIKSSTPARVTPALVAQNNANTQAQIIRAVAIFAALVVLSLVVGWLIAGRFLRPLRTITATAKDISASNLNRRLALNGRGDEFTELGETLDSLFGRLEASFESQRHFVANASHELRTPLAAERTLLQVTLADPDATPETLRAACEQVLTLGEQQERLIDALLTLASSERGIERREPFDLAGIARKVISDRRREAERRGIEVDTTLDTASAAGDPSLVESLVANLVDNAVRHNRAAGQVVISTTTTGGAAVVSVSNSGTLIKPGEMDRLYQPFQRLGSERIGHTAGHGLGLAIVHAIARAHGATVAAAARPEGGLDITVSFPDAHQDPAPDNHLINGHNMTNQVR